MLNTLAACEDMSERGPGGLTVTHYYGWKSSTSKTEKPSSVAMKEKTLVKEATVVKSVKFL